MKVYAVTVSEFYSSSIISIHATPEGAERVRRQEQAKADAELAELQAVENLTHPTVTELIEQDTFASIIEYEVKD